MKDALPINKLSYKQFKDNLAEDKYKFLTKVERNLVLKAKKYFLEEYNLEMEYYDTFIHRNKIAIVMKWVVDNDLLLSYVVTTDFNDINDLELSRFDMNETGIISSYIISKAFAKEIEEISAYLKRIFNDPIISKFPIHLNQNLYYNKGLYFSVIQKDFISLIELFKTNKNISFLTNNVKEMLKNLTTTITVGVDVYLDNLEVKKDNMKELEQLMVDLFDKEFFNNLITLSSKMINTNLLEPTKQVYHKCRKQA